MADTAETAGGAKKDTRVSRMALILGVVGALIVGGIVGVAVGWKVEQSRVKDDIANTRPVGRVTAINGDSMSVQLQSSSGTRTYVVTDDTTVQAAKPGETDDIARGSTVLVKNKRNADGDLEATEIIVLPKSSAFQNG